MSESIAAGGSKARRGPGEADALSSALLREMIRQAPVGVALFDRDLRFVEVNERLAEINGRPVSDHIGKRPQELLEGVPPEDYLDAAERALAGKATEAIELTGETPARPGVKRHWLESWAPVRAGDGEVTGVLAFVVEISDLRRAEEALRLREQRDRARSNALAELAAEMAAAASVEEMAAAVTTGAAAAAGAAFANLALLGANGRELEIHHQETLSPRIARRWSVVSLEEEVPLVDAVRRREPVFVHSPEENAQRYPLLAEDTDRAGLAATASLPLIDRRGGLLGAMGFAWSQPQAFEPDVRAVLGTIVQLTSQTLERVRLQEAERRDRERATVLAEASTAVGAPGSTRERLERVCARIVPDLCELAIIQLAPEGAGAQREVAIRGVDPDHTAALSAALAAAGAEATAATADLRASGRAMLISDVSAGPSSEQPLDPWLEQLRAIGVGSYLAAPLRAGPTVIGALMLGRSASERTLDPDDLAFAMDMGQRIGLMLDSVRLTEAEHEVAAELQMRLLPAALRTPPGTALAARYRAGRGRLEIGGDWYEVVTRDDGQAVVAIGDIVGHGPRAAAAMGQLRSALTATATSASSPADLLGRLDEFAARTPDVQLSTVFAAFLDPDDGRLRYASAGHLPPALLENGSARLLEDGRSMPLAARRPRPGRDIRRPEGSATLPPGGRLLLYTDGLIERRGASLDDALEQLRTALEESRQRPLETFCDALLEGLLHEASGEDDAALLCIERIGAGS